VNVQQAESTVIFRRWGDLSSSSGASPHSCSGSKRSRLDSYSARLGEDPTSHPAVNHSYWHHRWPALGAERDPVAFSYFLAANLPLPTEQLLQLLQARDVVDRLRLALCCTAPPSGDMPTCVRTVHHTEALLSVQRLICVPLSDSDRTVVWQAVHPVHGGGVWKGAGVRALQAATRRKTRSVHSARGRRRHRGIRQSSRVRWWRGSCDVPLA
jgi:hypothetical protein